MPLSPNFSASQAAGSLSAATFVDTSTGSDSGITLRLLYLQKIDGTYLVPNGVTTDYNVWPAASSSITISNLLDKDYALLATTKWFTGSSITYTKTILMLFSGYGDVFLRQLTQAEAGNRNLLNNKNFWQSKCKLRTLYDDAAQAVALLNDQTIATFCLNEGKEMMDNPEIFY